MFTMVTASSSACGVYCIYGYLVYCWLLSLRSYCIYVYHGYC
jgi:hypothetical protein